MVAVSHDYCTVSFRTEKNAVLFLAYYVLLMWRACLSKRRMQCK
jgi:hypothetical protein